MATKTLPANQPNSWRLSVIDHARQHPFTAAGLLLALAAIVFLLSQSLWLISTGKAEAPIKWALAGGLASFAATAVGALPALVLRTLGQKVEDTMLGFAAGMMLAAAAFSLTMPGIESGIAITGSEWMGIAVVVTGMVLGVFLMLGLDVFTPHEHDKAGPCGPGHKGMHRMLLFVFAIALHNMPEGMAIGVGFSQADMSVGLPLTIAIAIQNVPEGLAVAMVMAAAGFRPLTGVGVAGLTGLLEPLGAIVGVGIASGMAAAYPIGLGLAAGAMLFVVSHEVIPETHRNGHQTLATMGLVAGFAVLITLDTVLG